MCAHDIAYRVSCLAALIVTSVLSAPITSASAKRLDEASTLPYGASLVLQREVKKRWFFRATPGGPACPNLSCLQLVITVGRGKVLVIKHFSCGLAVDEGEILERITLRVVDGKRYHHAHAIPHFTGTDGSWDHFTAESSQEMVAREGEEVSLYARTSGDSINSAVCTVTGEMLKYE